MVFSSADFSETLVEYGMFVSEQRCLIMLWSVRCMLSAILLGVILFRCVLKPLSSRDECVEGQAGAYHAKSQSVKARTLLVLMALLVATTVHAEEDARCVWTAVSFDKSCGKWRAGLHSEYRHKIHEGVSKSDQYIARPWVSYKALPWLTVRYNMDFAATSSGFNVRSIPEVAASFKSGDFSFALRQRIMTSWNVENGTNSTVLRTRAKVDYSIPQTPLSANFAVEPYWCNFSKDSFAWFQKVRWYAGLSIRLLDNLTVVPQYVCQAYHNHQGKYARRTYDDHVFYLTFLLKL